MVCHYSLRYCWYYHNEKHPSGAVLQERCSCKFYKIHKKTPKVDSVTDVFLWILRNTFFKELFGRLLLYKYSLRLLSYHDLSPFQKRCRTFFLAEYFFGLICRLGTKVSSICKTLSQKPIFNLVKHLGWSFSCEKVNSSTPLGIFAKKLHCRCSTMF